MKIRTSSSFVLSLTLAACAGNKSNFASSDTSPTTQKSQNDVAATAAPSASPTNVSKDYSIKFTKVPDSPTSLVSSDFAISGVEEIASVLYTLDGGAEIEVAGQSFSLFAFYGDHNISVRAKFKDGAFSPVPLTQKWTVSAGGFVTREMATLLSGTNAGIGSEYRLTEAKTGQVGMVVSDNKVTFRWVEMNFSIQFSNLEAVPADGIVFGITEKAKDSIVPGAGGSLGFQGTGGFGVEFDIFQNPGDPAWPHVALINDGMPAAGTAAINAGVPHVSAPQRFDRLTATQGSWIPLTVCIESTGVFTVRVRDENRNIIDRAPMPNFPVGRDFNGYIFLSAATGDNWAEQHIRMENVSYNVVGESKSCHP